MMGLEVSIGVGIFVLCLFAVILVAVIKIAFICNEVFKDMRAMVKRRRSWEKDNE